MREPTTVLFWEDFQKGDVFVTPWGRTVTDADIKNFAGVVMGFQGIFMDDLFAQKAGFKGRVAHGALTSAIALSLQVYFQVFRNVVAFLEWEDKFLAPVYIGDTLRGEMTVTETRPTKKPDRGIVSFFNVLKNQHGLEVLHTKYTMMIRRREVQK